LRIAIIHDWLRRSIEIGGTAKADLHDAVELDLLHELDLIRASLTKAGHDPVIFAADDAAHLCEFLSNGRPDLVFNLCEAFAGSAALEMNVAALYELLGIPFTGCPALTLGLSLNKPVAKAILGANGIRTPDYVVIERGQDPRAAGHLAFPLIAKPVAEDASIGIDDGAVVNDMAALADRVKFLWREFRQPALVEEFVAGREFCVSLLASSPNDFVALPIVEISFDGLAPGRPQIFGYEAKWDPTAPFNHTMATRCPAQIEEPIANEIRSQALQVARTVGLRDYGRVDFRLRESDQTLFVLEVNPNPDLSDECAFMRAAQASGRTTGGTICEIVERAIERCGFIRLRRKAKTQIGRKAKVQNAA
jgi:D-alanine-D-alanine ligase